MSLCPGSGMHAEKWTRVVLDHLGVSIRTSRCMFCEQRVLVQRGRLIEHQATAVKATIKDRLATAAER